MEYNSVTIFRFEGISSSSFNDDKIILSDSDLGLTVLLTTDVDKHCQEIDTGRALAHICFTGGLRDREESEIESIVGNKISDIQKARSAKKNTGSYVVIHITGDVDVSVNKDLHTESDKYRVCFDAVDKDALDNKINGTIESALVSISLHSDPAYFAENVAKGLYFRDENEKLLFSYTLTSGGVRAILSKPFDDETINSVANLIYKSNNNPELRRIFRLYSQSLEAAEDRFRAFLAAWTALEIFINKTFGFYERIFLSNISHDHESHGVSQFLERIKEVMKDRYRLTDKLCLIASFLSNDIEADIREFKEIKKLRDDVFHGDSFDDDALPLEQTRKLIGRYLECHLNYQNGA